MQFLKNLIIFLFGHPLPPMMGTEEISELERLATSPSLVTPFPYDNPNRKLPVFLEFLHDYASYLGMNLSEQKIGFIAEKKIQFRNLAMAIIDGESTPGSRIVYGLISGFYIIFTPIIYPLFGALAYADAKGERFIAYTPKYRGIAALLPDYAPHEYMHAYHRLVSVDLDDRGLLNIDGYFDIGLMEPGMKVPTAEDLKSFERRFLKKMIKKENKFLERAQHPA
jgi:hypothetical protein